MLTALLIPLVALPVVSANDPLPADDPPVHVWLSRSDVVWPGDRVRVYAEARGDGYLVVLHAEPDGRIRVLFPIDPTDDNFVRGGSRYEVLSRADREAITVFASEGVGTVFAAFSRDPFRFDELAQDGHWNYRLPDAWWVIEDPESDLLALADRMAGGIAFDYDVQRYGVAQTVAAYGAPVPYGYAYPAYTYPAYLSIGFTFGVPYFAYSYPNPVCWDWFYCYPGGGWYYYGPYYRPYYYGGYYGHYGYPSYGYWRYPRAYYPYYPKYAGKGPSYYPKSPGVDYRRRTGVPGTATAVGTASGVGRRTPATAPAGTGGRRTAPATGTPAAGGRRTTPAGTREAPRSNDAGRRTPAKGSATGAPAAGGRRSAPAGTREAPAPAQNGTDRRKPTDQSSGLRSAPETPARPAAGTPRRGSAESAATGLRTVERSTSQRPERVEPTRNGVPSSRGVARQSTGTRVTGSSRQTASTRTAAPTSPQRVVPSRSITTPGRLPTRVPARASAPAQTRAAGSRAVSVGGRTGVPRAPSSAGRAAPRASAPRMVPRAPAVSAPRAPAPRAPAVRAPAVRAPSARRSHR